MSPSSDVAIFYIGQDQINIRVFCTECSKPVSVNSTKIWNQDRDNDPGLWLDVEIEFSCPECESKRNIP